MKIICIVMLIFLNGVGLFADDKGNAAVLQDIPQIPDIFLLNPTLDLGFGDVAGEDYEFSGRNGRAYIRPGFDVVKAFGPFALVGQLYDTVGLSSPDSYNALDIKLIPLLLIPQANLLVGAQFSGYFPFHDGRLIADIAQMPPASSFFANIANLGITSGAQYTHIMPFGALYGSFLFITNKPLVSNDWTLQGDLELGIKTGLGLSAFVSPFLIFLAAGEAPDPVYTALEFQVAYGVNPISAGITVTLPGAQKDGFKNYGMNISTRFQYTFKSNLEVWGSVELRGVGNSVDNDIAVVPALGVKYYIPLMNYLSPAVPEGEALASVPAGIPDGSGPVGAKEGPPGKTSHHWYIGLSGGYANNTLYASTGGRALTEYDVGHGLEVAIPVRYQVVPWFAVQTGIQYIQKNYVWRRTGEFNKVESRVTNSFIEFPLLANFSVGMEKLRLFANAGGYAGIWIDSWRKGTQIENTTNPFDSGTKYYYYDYDERLEFDDRRDARFEAGLLAGLGLQYAFKPCILFVEGRYYYGLTDLQQDYGYNMIPRMNDTVTVTLGVLFNRDIFSGIGGGK